MEHQIIKIVWSGATRMKTVEALLSIRENVTSRLNNAGIISELKIMLFFT